MHLLYRLAILPAVLWSFCVSGQNLAIENNVLDTSSETKAEVANPCPFMSLNMIELQADSMFSSGNYSEAAKFYKCLHEVSPQKRMKHHVADFLADSANEPACNHGCYTFDATDGIPVVPEDCKVQWIFPDGEVVEGIKGTKCFAEEGIYMVKFQLTVPQGNFVVKWDTTLSLDVSRPFESCTRQLYGNTGKEVNLKYRPRNDRHVMWVMDDGRFQVDEEIKLNFAEVSATGYKLFAYDDKFQNVELIEVGEIIIE